MKNRIYSKSRRITVVGLCADTYTIALYNIYDINNNDINDIQRPFVGWCFAGHEVVASDAVAAVRCRNDKQPWGLPCRRRRRKQP